MIKAAEQRLAFADRSEKALQFQLDAIRAQLNATKSQLSATKTQIAAAQGEVKEATAFLKETREKLQVIDVDEDDGVEISARKRKRKTEALLPPDEPENGIEKKVRVDFSTDDDAMLYAIGKSIVMAEAGTVEANGTYRLCRSYDSCLKWADTKFPVWSKDVQWWGKDTTFYIFRHITSMTWWI